MLHRAVLRTLESVFWVWFAFAGKRKRVSLHIEHLKDSRSSRFTGLAVRALRQWSMWSASRRMMTVSLFEKKMQRRRAALTRRNALFQQWASFMFVRRRIRLDLQTPDLWSVHL